MQTLFIPEKIIIELKDQNGNSFNQKNILFGIKTFANRRNDIELSPFISNENGVITITKNDIEKNLENFYSYGLMDYSSIESAKPEIEIYYWGNKNLENYLKYWSKILEGKADLKQYEIWGEKLGKRESESAKIEKRERDEMEIYSSCKNREFKQIENVTILKDNWGKPKTELNYIIEFNIK
jgi:hypothetical protein